MAAVHVRTSFPPAGFHPPRVRCCTSPQTRRVLPVHGAIPPTHVRLCCRSLAEVPGRDALADRDNLEFIIIDAQRVGNCTRFCNHSCAPNLETQTLFRPDAGCAALYYHMLVADENIPALVPLSWDYKMDAAVREGRQQGSVRCLCGAPTCRKWLR